MISKSITFLRKQWILTCFLFLLAVSFSLLAWRETTPSQEEAKKIALDEDEKIEEVCADCVRRKIDGVFVDRGEENLFPISVMIENHLDARPQLGLDKAQLVYETEVEGAVTRFLAVFASDASVEKIGPVRSARAYFLDWANEFGSLYAHCGGSPEALEKIKTMGIFDFNEFYNGSYFWRDRSRWAPHNLYTSLENLKNFLKTKNKTVKDYESWKYKDDRKSDIASSTIELYFKEPDFVVKWKYNQDENNYIRHQAGQVHKMAGGEEIAAKNVIVQYAQYSVIDDSLRLKMETIGSGEALICLDGRCRQGQWKKPGSSRRTFYFYEDGSEVEFNAGSTWIEVIKKSKKVSVE